MNALLDAYLAGDAGVASWYGGDWRSAAIADHEPRRLADGLAEDWANALMRYDTDANAGDALRRLAAGRAIAIVTGQQPALGGGPLFTLAKTAHAVAVARHLSATGTPAVPVFWCASEDHDRGEADHADLIARAACTASTCRGPSLAPRPVSRTPRPAGTISAPLLTRTCRGPSAPAGCAPRRRAPAKISAPGAAA